MDQERIYTLESNYEAPVCLVYISYNGTKFANDPSRILVLFACMEHG